MGWDNIFGGALSGLGQGMALKGQSEAEDRRKMALEAARQQSQVTLESYQHTNKLDEIAATGEQQRLTQVNAGNVDVAKVAATTPITTKAQIEINNAKAANDAVLENLKSKLRMTEAQAEAATKLANEISAAGQKAAEFRVAADGSMVAYSATGQVLRKSAPGSFIPQQPGGLGTDLFATPVPAPAQQPAPQRPVIKPIQKPAANPAAKPTGRAPNRPSLSSFDG